MGVYKRGNTYYIDYYVNGQRIREKAGSIKKIADAKKVSFSVEGSNKVIDYIFNERYLYCFKRFYKECVLPDEKLGIPGIK